MFFVYFVVKYVIININEKFCIAALICCNFLPFVLCSKKTHRLPLAAVMVTRCLLEIGIILPVINLLAASIILFFTFQFIKAKSKGKIQSMVVFCLSLICFLVQSLYLVTHAVRDFLYCDNPDFYVYFENATWCLFTAQYAFLLFLFFDRLRRTFVGSAEELSRCTVYTFYITYTVWLLVGMCSFVVHFVSQSLYYMCSFVRVCNIQIVGFVHRSIACLFGCI